MKKSDPTGTSATIELTESTAVGDFPYQGFWSIVGQSAFNGVELQGASYQDRQNVISAIANLINGPGRIFLADKIWEIGETINLNGKISLTGLSAGYSIGTVPTNMRDNGHLFIASKCLEKPMQELWSSVVTKSTAYSEAESIRPSIETALTQLYEEQVALQALLQSMPTDNEITIQTNRVNGLTGELNRFATEEANLQGEINAIQEELMTMNSYRAESNSLTNVLRNTGKLLNQTLVSLRNASNHSNREQDHAKATQLQMEYRDTTNRLNAIQSALGRLENISNRNAIGGMQQLLSVRTLEKQSAAANLSNQNILLNQMNNSYTKGQEAAIQGKANIDALTEQIASLQEAYEQASSYSAATMNLNDNELIKIFAEHLDSVQYELEALLFEALRQSSSELTATRNAMAEDVETEDVVDYRNYLSALSDVGDAFTEDEYTLLRHIADFGYSRNYVPGSTRLYSLVSLGPTDRRRAFRTLIEEILTLGSSLEEDNLSSDGPLFTLKMSLKRKDNDLREMSQLIDFLTTRKPEINWKQG
jgi:septal ring factor EnvC (AmiA/AmiB activator)